MQRACRAVQWSAEKCRAVHGQKVLIKNVEAGDRGLYSLAGQYRTV